MPSLNGETGTPESSFLAGVPFTIQTRYSLLLLCLLPGKAWPHWGQLALEALEW